MRRQKKKKVEGRARNSIRVRRRKEGRKEGRKIDACEKRKKKKKSFLLCLTWKRGEFLLLLFALFGQFWERRIGRKGRKISWASALREYYFSQKKKTRKVKKKKKSSSAKRGEKK